MICCCNVGKEPSKFCPFLKKIQNGLKFDETLTFSDCGDGFSLYFLFFLCAICKLFENMSVFMYSLCPSLSVSFEIVLSNRRIHDTVLVKCPNLILLHKLGVPTPAQWSWQALKMDGNIAASTGFGIHLLFAELAVEVIRMVGASIKWQRQRVLVPSMITHFWRKHCTAWMQYNIADITSVAGIANCINTVCTVP